MTAVRTLLAVLLVIAAGSKLLEWSRWQYSLYGDNAWPWITARVAAISIPTTEMLAALLILRWVKVGGAVGIVLWGSFAAWTAWQRIKSRHGQCHCFGLRGERATWIGVIGRGLAAAASAWIMTNSVSVTRVDQSTALFAVTASLIALLVIRVLSNPPLPWQVGGKRAL